MAWNFKKKHPPVDSPNAGKKLPAGMRNNNPGNIKFVGQADAIGPSKNTDQGDPQAVYKTPEAGMSAMYRLLRKKYASGKTTPRQMIAEKNGWTPGNLQAAKNVAASAGIGLDDDINLGDPASALKFIRGLVRQEHGPASDAYSDSMIASAITGGPIARESKGRAHGTGGSSLGVGVGGSNIEGGLPADAGGFDVAGVELSSDPTLGEMIPDMMTDENILDEEEKTLADALGQGVEFSGFEGTDEIASAGLERSAELKDEILAMMAAGLQAEQQGPLPRLPGFPQIEI